VVNLLLQGTKKMLRIAILASGSGSNAQALVEHFAQSQWGRVEIIVTNNPLAGVIERAERLGVRCKSFNPKIQSDEILSLLESSADIILLAGYLRMIPANWTRAFQGRMFNIHPALLPKFGGKGMYGKHVHQAVSAAGESVTGITIHMVNEHYDEGAIVAQYQVEITPGEPAQSIEEKVRELELEYFAPTIETWIAQLSEQQ
jgi:phosphoribosylglycinamide formyltransferase-1